MNFIITNLDCNNEKAYRECGCHSGNAEPQMGEKYIVEDEVVDGNWKYALNKSILQAQ